MKTRKGIHLILTSAMAAALCLTGCGGASKTSSSFAVDNSDMYEISDSYNKANYEAADLGWSDSDLSWSDSAAEAVQDVSDLDTDAIDLTQGRKIIYTADLNLETKAYDDTIAALKNALAEAGGYIESSYLSGSAEDSDRCADFTFRIPVDSYSDFLTACEGAGSLISKNEGTEDVTSTYVDVQARISSLQSQMTRLEELEAQAENLEDLLAIENQISSVQYQLESYEGQLKELDDQIESTTVSVYVSEVQVLTPAAGRSFGGRIVDSFRDGISGFVTGIQDLIVWFVGALPWIVLIGVIVWLIRIILKHLPKRKKKKGDEKTISLNKDEKTN